MEPIGSTCIDRYIDKEIDFKGLAYAVVGAGKS